MGISGKLRTGKFKRGNSLTYTSFPSSIFLLLLVSIMRKVLFIVLDGWGLYQDYPGNAVTKAKTPFIDKLWKKSATATLEASGETVGLPEGQMGTSEVNHFTIGAGKVVFQDLVRINKAISDESFYSNPEFIKAFEHVKKHNSNLHILGLVSNGGVHSEQEHIEALIKAAQRHEVRNTYIHAFTDGRDTPPNESIHNLKSLETLLTELNYGKIATIIGRYFAMDRDNNANRTKKAFDLITKSKGVQFVNAEAAILESYKHDITDEFIEPVVINHVTVQKNDAIICANFRNDRMRQLVTSLLERKIDNLHITTMTQYHPDYPVGVAFEQHKLTETLGSAVSKAGYSQFRITETEKFAHMTFFLNCKREEPYLNETRFMFESYKDIKTHDERPVMRAPDIAGKIAEVLEQETYDLICTNLCNADMLGHTGNIPAAIIGCEAIDQALKMLIPLATEHNYTTIITADHGNAEMMIDPHTGQMLTSHTTNPVPLIIIHPNTDTLKRHTGTLIDLAPTILTLMDIPVPEQMTGKSFI